MDFVPVLRAIDAEIEKLEGIRAIVVKLKRPSRILQQSLVFEPLPTPAVTVEEPHVVVLPARKKREYRARTRSAAKDHGALAAPPSTAPVFVPRSATPIAAVAPRSRPAELTPEQMEAAVRLKLLGVA